MQQPLSTCGQKPQVEIRDMQSVLLPSQVRLWLCADLIPTAQQKLSQGFSIEMSRMSKKTPNKTFSTLLKTNIFAIAVCFFS